MQLIVTNALVSVEHQPALHPSIMAWRQQLENCNRNWFFCADKNPLGWYAALCGSSPAALLAEKCEAIPEHTSQCWVASPYHAQLGRDSVSVFPEGLFPCSSDDALHLCETLNPLLTDEGMQLLNVGAALLLACRERMDAWPAGFGAISGKRLPNRHHEGEDGGRLNRLLSEIQMLLFQHPSVARHDRGEVDINGIWLWAPTDWPVATGSRQIAAATRNPQLQSIVDGQDAGLMISEAERLGELVQKGAPLPKRIVLAGEGYAALLQRSFLPKFSKQGWQPKSARSESDLDSMLSGLAR
jgi:hypothetical protein